MTAGGPRSSGWKWAVCGILFFASAINYMDRLTLANASVRITHEFHLNEEQYGRLEFAFGWSFAAGSLLSGWLADRVALRWFYPLVLALWSGVGFATGCARSYGGLLLCRSLLGLFEAGQWPCALRTTQRLLSPADRTMGNGILLGGVSVGAVASSLLMSHLVDEPGGWRFAFQALGAVGLLWIVAWFALVPARALHPAAAGESVPPPAAADTLWRVLASRRFALLLIGSALINVTFQLLRAWLPRILIEGRGYAEPSALRFNALFYVACDLGCLGVGAATLWLHRRSLSVHQARMAAFFGCALLALLCLPAAGLPQGWPLLVLLLLVGAGALGVFPIVYSLTQELSVVHQGKVIGLAGVAAWVIASPTQLWLGRWVDRTHSFDDGLRLLGIMPILAFFAFWLFWDRAPGAPAASS